MTKAAFESSSREDDYDGARQLHFAVVELLQNTSLTCVDIIIVVLYIVFWVEGKYVTCRGLTNSTDENSNQCCRS